MGTSHRVLKVTEGGGTPGEIQFGANGYTVTMKGNSALATDATITLPDIISDVHYNVKDYGADETGVTECGAEIQAAITAAQNAGGGTVYFPTGTYKVNYSSLTITASNIRLKGAPGATIEAADAPGTSTVLIKVYSGSGQITDIEIDHLALDGNGEAWANGSSTTQSHIIDALHVSRFYVHHCRFLNSAGDFVRCEYGDVYTNYVVIDSNYMETCRRNGITINANFASVTNNTINGFNTDGIVWEPDQDLESRRIYIAGNKIVPNPTKLECGNGNRFYGIAVKNAVALNENKGQVIVQGNTVEGVLDAGTQYPQQGIYVDKCYGFSIVGNQIRETSQGISVADIGSCGEIIGNHVRLCADAGIRPYSNTLVLGNIVEHCGDAGIWIYRGNNTIIGNTCRCNGTAGGTYPYGIWMEVGPQIVSGNRCHNTYQVTGDVTLGSPIVTDIDTTTITAGDTISGDGIDAGSTVLSVDSATQITLSKDATSTPVGGNVALTLVGTYQTYGIYLKSGTTMIDTLIVNNHVSGNVTAGISPPSPLRNIIIRGNFGYDQHVITGNLEWGDGTNAPDTNIYRSAANVLKTDDAFTCSGILTVTTGGASITGDTTITGKHFVDQNADANGVEVDHDGDTGYAIYAINKSGNTDECLRIVSNGAEGAVIGTTASATATTLQVEQAANFVCLTLSKTASGAGHVIDISNDGTGHDIDGDSGLWYTMSNGVVKMRSVTNDTERSALSMTGSGDLGGMIWNVTDNAPNFWDGSGWRDASGSAT